MNKKEGLILFVITAIIIAAAVLIYPHVQPAPVQAQNSQTQTQSQDQSPVQGNLDLPAPIQVDQSYLSKPPVSAAEDNKTDKKPVVKKTSSSSVKTPASTPAPAKNKRVPTGKGKTLSFKKGDTVFGYRLDINGKTYINKVIKNAPMCGKVTDGVIWPSKAEIAKVAVVDNCDITAIVIKPEPTPIVEKNNRIETGAGKSLEIKIGDTFCGYKVVFSNGKTYSGGIVVKNSPYTGTLTDGVIWPSDPETKNLKIIDPKVDKPDNAQRIVVGANSNVNFTKGDTIVAKEIHINSKIFYNALIVDAPYSGYITNGIIWPTASEMSSYKLVNPDKDPTQYHQRSSSTGTFSIKKGDSVWAKEIIIGDKLYTNTYIINASGDGKATNGVLWPNDSDIPKDATKIIFP